MTNKFRLVITLCSALTMLSACDTMRDQFAPPRAPDEFSVMRRAPLERPEAVYTDANQLPTPVIGKARPQEVAPIVEAEQALIGKANAAAAAPMATPAASTAGLDELLAKTGANNADPTIRNSIEAEHYRLSKEQQSTVDKLLGKVTNKQPGAKIVDAKGEFERLKKNREEGKAVTEGETPTLKMD